MSTLRPKRIGDVPLGLNNHHREFLHSLKDNIEILTGAVMSQDDTDDPPGSQAVTFDDLSIGSNVNDEIDNISLIDRINALDAQLSIMNYPELLSDEEKDLFDNINAEMAMMRHFGGDDSIDHGSISGLDDDDHEQYILVDGSRAFTGDISHTNNSIFSVNSIYLNNILHNSGVITIGAAPQTLTVDANGPIELTLNSGATNNFIIETDMFIVKGASGLIGINESSPEAMLEIVTNSNTEEGLKIKGSASQSGSLLLLTDDSDNIFIDSGDGLAGSEFVGNEQGANIDFRWEGTGESALFFIDASNDRIGFGTSTPSALLDFYRDQNSTTTMKINNPNTGASAKAQLRFTAGTFDANFILDGSGDASDPRFRIGTIDAGLDMTFKTTNTDRMRITDTGVVKTLFGRVLNEIRYTGVATIAATDDVIWGDTDGGGFTLTLPDGAGGERYTVSNTGTSGNALTLAADASDTIEGGASIVLYDGETAIIKFNSTDNEWIA